MAPPKRWPAQRRLDNTGSRRHTGALSGTGSRRLSSFRIPARHDTGPLRRLVIVLGKIAFDTYLKTRGVKPLPACAHNRVYDFSPPVLASYHPSRQNTNTGRLSADMMRDVFALARASIRRR